MKCIVCCDMYSDSNALVVTCVTYCQMLLLIQKLLSSDSFNDVVAMATLLQTLSVMVSSLGSVSGRHCHAVQPCAQFSIVL